MAVLKTIFSSLRKLFGQRFPRGKKRKRQRNVKQKVRKKVLSRAPRLSRKKAQKKPEVSSSNKKSPRAQAPAAVSAVRGKSPSGKTQPPGQPVGEITHYFSKIQVVVVKMTKGNLAVGDKIRVHGKSTDFTQTVRSMQVESVDVRSARRGQLIGLKVARGAKVGDKLYKLV